MEDPASRPAPIPLRVGRDDDRTVVALGDDQLQLLPFLEHLNIEVSADGVYATIILRVRPDFDMPAEVAQLVPALDGVTAKELDDAIGAAGFSTSPGAAVLRHLRDRQL